MKHISIRLAWHNDGWNGHICKEPKKNTYCIGQYSYHGEVIKKNRDLKWEAEEVAGLPCSKLGKMPPCAVSMNAFGKISMSANVEPPDWYNEEAKAAEIILPPATACTWPFEGMYDENARKNPPPGQIYNYQNRLKYVREYFKELTEQKSLIFYYVNYSNPFSEDENKKYVIVGISRLKKKGEVLFYDGVSDEIKRKNAGGFVWQFPITSNYPDEGFRIPYENYMDQPEILKEILFVPENTYNFKYASKHVDDDDALSIVEKLLEIVKTLIEIKDTSQDWEQRKIWLLGLLTELWQSRGAFPGLPGILHYLDFEEAIEFFKNETIAGKEKEAKEQLFSLLNEKINRIQRLETTDTRLKEILRDWQLKDDIEKNLLEKVLCRFLLTKQQIINILDDQRADNSLYATLEEIYENPYILAEQYIGDDLSDSISFNRIDHGILPSAELGLEPLFAKNSPERFRALCVEQLQREGVHSFISAETILNNVNKKLSYLPDWKKEIFKIKYFMVDKDFLSKALTLRNDARGNLFIYLNQVYEAERNVQDVISDLVNRPDLTYKVPITKRLFIENLRDSKGSLAKNATVEYEDAVEGQADVCLQIFNKPISVISGGAGTGKTTIVRELIQAIEKAHGVGTSFYLMAPTGKASEKLKEKSQKSTSTIHSFLAKNGWLNDNFTFKLKGGKVATGINVLIIDECSMIDLELFAALFRAVNWHDVQRLILVGDPNQLPPIGRGKVFADIISYLQNYYPDNLGILKNNVRQLENKVLKKGGGILDLAAIYNKELQKGAAYDKTNKENLLKKLQEGGDIDKDLRVIYWKETEDLEILISDTIIHDLESETALKFDEERPYELWSTAHSKRPDNKAHYLQILSPYRGELYGTEYINIFIQSLFNHHHAEHHSIDGIALFDKVIQFCNRPKSNPISAYNFSTRKPEYIEIFNGEIGFVRPHAFDAEKWKHARFRIERFQVSFDKKDNYLVGFGRGLGKDMNDRWIDNESPEENLELAYAISIHKAQGSEFEKVYLILPKARRILLSMELLYTAITRAQRHLTILAQEDVSTFVSYGRVENSILDRINSSIFDFAPLPNEIINLYHFMDEGKVHSTLTEYFVRSKSEMNIANILALKEIPFEYERPLFAPDGTMYLPDFTIKWKGKEYYWEHLGMLDNEQYKAHWEEKKAWYAQHFPGQLIESKEGREFSKEVDALIDKWFKP